MVSVSARRVGSEWFRVCLGGLTPSGFDFGQEGWLRVVPVSARRVGSEWFRFCLGGLAPRGSGFGSDGWLRADSASKGLPRGSSGSCRERWL